MKEVTYHKLESSIVIHVSGKTFVIPKGDYRFDQISSLIKSNSLDKIGDIADDEAKNEIKLLLKFKD